MSRLIVKGFALVVVFYSTIVVIAGFDSKHKIVDDNSLRLKAAEKMTKIDYLFIGSSYAYSGIIPAIFDSTGVNTFNLGIATAGPFFNEIVLDDYLSVHEKPNYLFIIIAHTTFSEIASDVWSQYPIHRYLSYPLSNEEVFMRYTSPITYFEMLRKSFKKGTENIFTEKNEIDSAALREIETSRGYFKSIESTGIEKLKDEKEIFLPYLKSIYSDRKEKKLLEIVAKCRKLNIKIILIEPPTYKLQDFFSIDFKNKYSRFMEKLQNDSIKILRDSQNSYDSSCFRNTDHLNYKGASIFTNYVRRNFKSL